MRLYWCDSGDDHDGPDDHEDFNEDVQVNPIKKVLIVRIYLQAGTFRGVPVKKHPVFQVFKPLNNSLLKYYCLVKH